MLQRYHPEVFVDVHWPQVEMKEDANGDYVEWNDLLPLLRGIKEVNQYLRYIRLHSNPAIRNELIDKALEKLQAFLDATKGVDG